MSRGAPSVTRDPQPMIVAGRPELPNRELVVRDVFTGAVASHVPLASSADVERAIAAAHGAREAMAALSAHARREILRDATERLRDARGELVHLLGVEAGKPAAAAVTEVDRMLDTFELAAEEATRICGDVLPMDVTARTVAYRGYIKRVPVGACALITPFNFPLNLVAHKVAPAIACGCPFVLKPADKTPLGGLRLAEVLAGTDLPEGAVNALVCRVEDAAPLVEDPRLPLLSFTGSDVVGKALAKQAGMKKLVLELGGNAACVVDAGVDLDDVADRIVTGGYGFSGQSCISVQRVIAHADAYEALRDRLVARVGGLQAGDPRDPDTDVGPMIDEDAAKRVEAWVREAVDAGARVLVGGGRDGAVHEATLLEDAPRDAKVVREEVFGPVVVLSRYTDFDEALDRVNDSRFGLQAGVFTHDLRRMHRAWDRLEVGGVVINDVPTFRVDHMPYGGVKQSGLGREGVRWSIEDMTELRMLVVRDPPEDGRE